MNKHSLLTFISIVAITLTLIGYLQHPTDQRSRSASGTLPAFPGAEGFGATTVGGRGGKVLEVSNVNDSGAGSLRECVNAVGPRICVFRTGGTITLSSRLSIKNPFITIAGQTAPGGGIQIRGHTFEIATHDVIVRYLKLRPGDTVIADATGIDALFLNGTGTNEVYNVVVDHTSMTWGPDTGGVSMSVNVHDVTVQHSISGEGLYLSNHAEGTVANGGHSKGIVISDLQAVYGATHPSRITLHHNLVTTADERNPSLQLPENIDIVNNVFYNWGNLGAFGDVYSLNLIKNYFIKGPKTTKLLAWEPNAKSGSPRNSSVYEQGNIVEGFTTVRGGSSSVYTTTRFSPYSISTEQTPQEAYTKIVAEVGANLPLRDSVDQRIISNLTTRTGDFVNGVNAPEPRISWPTLAAGTPPTDSDHDGMPDNWEQTNFGNLNQGGATNSSSDFDSDGYTDLEEFLNGTNPQPTNTSGRTFYVSKNGSNGDGRSWASAWSELSSIAWSTIQPGDTILIDGGATSMIYTSALIFSKNGTATAPIKIQLATESGRNGKAIIFGGRSTPLPYCEQTNYVYQNARANGIEAGNASYVTIDGTKWRGITIYGHNNNGINLSSNSRNLTFRNIEIYDNGNATQSSGSWHSDQEGVYLSGTNISFEQAIIHDNGQDAFQSGGGVSNFTLKRSWVYQGREHPSKPGYAFNECRHPDGIQIYDGGTQSGVTIIDSIIGPGFNQGTILGQSPASAGQNAIINNVTIQNTLFINATGTNIMGYPNVQSQNWKLSNVTSFMTAKNGVGDTHNTVYLIGSGHSVANSIFYQGNIFLSGATASGNCQFNTTGNTSVIGGQTVNPQFLGRLPTTNTPSLQTMMEMDFSLNSSSPCAGKGSTITSVASLLGSPMLTATPTQVVPQPTSTLAPSVTVNPQATRIAVTILLHGIGKGGDNVNPNGTGNMSPIHSERQASIELFNSNNNALPVKTGTVTFHSATGIFKGVIDVGAVPSGPYTVKISSSGYLKRLIPGIVQLTVNSQNTLPQVALITGDSNRDNQINILDYNMLIDCFSDIAPAKNCSDGNKKLAADLTDDGNVNQFDYNVFLRELSVQTGE